MNKTTLKNDATLIGKLIAVEIEYFPRPGTDDVSTTAPSDPNALVNVIGDGSLGYAGKEICVLSLTSDEGRIDEILNLKIDGRVDKRCGLHVHVDARHLGRNGLLTVEQTYDRLTSTTHCKENLNFCFKKLVPKSRHGNKYCRWKSNRSFGCDRRSAFNFQAFREHGTIEFRMQGGSTNKEKIEMWALVCKFWLNYAADPANAMPTSWSTFIKTMPNPLRSWCVARRLSLHGTDGFELQLSRRMMRALVDGIGEEGSENV
jgi:hypothetical protein